MSRTPNRDKSGNARPRLGTQFRGQMSTDYAARGNSHADLMLHYSPKTKKDVVLSGQLQLLNFFRCEIDSNVTSINYAPTSSIATLVGEKLASLVDVEIIRSDGKMVWRRLVQSEPDTAQFVEDLRTSVGRGLLAKVCDLEVMTYEKLTANAVLIRNGLRAVSWMCGARYWPLGEFKGKAFRLIDKKRTVTFDEVLALEQGPRRALVGAAVLEMACTGAVRSNLAEVPLHAMTLFHRMGDESCQA